MQPLPDAALLGAQAPDLLSAPAVAPEWLRGIPGRTVAAIQLALVTGDLSDERALMNLGQTWFGGHTLVASQLGNGHSWALTEFRIGADGFERMLVIAPPGTTDTRAGRITQQQQRRREQHAQARQRQPRRQRAGPPRPASHRQSDPFQPINTCTKIQIGLATTLSSPLGGHDKNGRFSSYHPETAESA